MGSFEKKIFEANVKKLQEEEKKITKEQLMEKILEIKCNAYNNPNAINRHLKDIDNKVLFDSLREEDYEAFKKAFNDEWTEYADDFKQYMEDVLYWKKKEMMDSGVSPKLRARRDFAAMIRSYVINRTDKLNREKKENIMKIAKNADISNN